MVMCVDLGAEKRRELDIWFNASIRETSGEKG